MSKHYKEAGVDLEAGYKGVQRIKKHLQKTMIKGVGDFSGGFGGLFDLGTYEYKEPVLVSGTDGIGTKLLLAIENQVHHTIGIDLVAMSVNDVLAQGARPLFFLDYIAISKNNPDVIEDLVSGIAKGCVEAKCALIGGETAEMNDLYQDNHYDLAGFCVGVVEKKKLIDGSKIKDGDILIGIPSAGLHANGYSLVRKIILKDHALDLNLKHPLLEKTLLEELLMPTKIYVGPVLKLLEKIEVKGMSHITGGGFYENLPRMLPKGYGANIDKKSFPKLKIFELLAELGNISEKEMYNVFNMGIGYVLVVDQKDVEKTLEVFSSNNEEALVIGEVTRTGEIIIND